MSLSKEQIIDRLVILFPNRVIHREEYESNKIPIELSQGIRKLSRPEGMSSIQWLTANGFFWKETGYIEDDMREGDSPISHEDAYSLAETVMRRYPLVGQYELSSDEMSMLLLAAQKAFDKLPIKGEELNSKEKLVLTLATVELLKDWAGASDNEEDSTFWGYVYLQYGYKKGVSDSTDGLIYRNFCAAIQNTFTSFHRFMAGEGTNRYYSSLLLHAVSPVVSIENFFDILFDFYTDNLDYQYAEEDPCYKTFVKSMAKRWDDSLGKTGTYQLRSLSVRAGLKTLFLERPAYMAVLCDKLVRNIDQMIRGVSISDLDCENDRWVHLLAKWFSRKANTSALRGAREKRNREFVATSPERIYIKYRMEKGKASLFVPRIRLSSEIKSRPVLKVYQDNIEIYASPLSVSGRTGSKESEEQFKEIYTTQSKYLSLDETEIDFSRAFNICAEIETDGKVIYTSGSKLFRDYIVIDLSGAEIGKERIPRVDTFYLLCSEETDCFFSNEDGVYQLAHAAQLFRINAGDVGAVTVGGEELFADVKHAKKLRLYPSSLPVSGALISWMGKEYQIFKDISGFSLHVPDGQNIRRYHVSLDDCAVTEGIEVGDDDWTYLLDAAPNVSHSIKVRDLEQEIIALEYNFVSLPDFSFQLDKQRYLDTDSEVNVSISTEHGIVSLSAFRESGMQTVRFQSSEGFEYVIDLPLVCCNLGEQSLFELPKSIWYEDIRKEDYAVLSLPSGWSSYFMLTEKQISENSDGYYELGNYLHSGIAFHETEQLWLRLISPDGDSEDILLSMICFKRHFRNCPVVVENGALWWRPEDNYMGPAEQRMVLKLEGPQPCSFNLSIIDKKIGPLDRILHGWYQCRVTVPLNAKASLFSKETKQILFDKEIYIGDEREVRFAGRELVLTRAVYWNFHMGALENKEMNPQQGIIADFIFQGSSVPSGEDYPFDEYVATLYYEDRAGRRIPFNNREDRSGYELINPVHIWIINEQRLILRAVTDDAVYFDNQYGSIFNKDPYQTVPKKEQMKRLQNPDYFTYEERNT